MNAKAIKATNNNVKPTTSNKEIEPVTSTQKVNAFAGAADVLGVGIDALFAQSDDPEFMVDLEDIQIVDQVREQMEDDEQDLNGLGESLAKYQIQAIFLRIMPAGHPKPYRLVAGERRYRAAKLKGLPQLRAKARELTDDEAEDLQFAENVHRKNLTQIEEAKKVQRDLDKLGSVEAVLEKHQKSRPWLSKMMALLHLPEQAKRLVTEKVSADIEVINGVKTIEKADPMKAKALVDDLKKTRGKVNAREKVQAVKEEVKPSKKPKAPQGNQGGTVATPKNRSVEQPSAGDIFAGAKSDDGHIEGADPFKDRESGTDTKTVSARPVVFSPAEVMNRAYTNVYENGASPKTVLEVMTADDKEAVEGYLQAFYDAGKQAPDVGRAVIQGFRKGQFSSDGDGAFALVAFLHGGDSDAKFNMLNIFASVKE